MPVTLSGLRSLQHVFCMTIANNKKTSASLLKKILAFTPSISYFGQYLGPESEVLIPILGGLSFIFSLAGLFIAAYYRPKNYCQCKNCENRDKTNKHKSLNTTTPAEEIELEPILPLTQQERYNPTAPTPPTRPSENRKTIGTTRLIANKPQKIRRVEFPTS